jgi:anthranilate synthase component I
VRRAQEYVRAGDIYQANLSRAWSVRLDARPGALYEHLRAANPAPFAALAQYQGVAILSSSPERLVRVDGRRVDTRPIAGTRPRSRRPEAESAEMSELAAHPKERAEHIMLIDLERNDLGRVCEAGTVRVDELMTIESYQHVHHIVSNVSGVLRAEVTPVGAIRAVFPGGTITGCPKFRCMQIIAELEGEGRGAYTGSLGYLTRDGRLDLNILIRTMSLQGHALSFRAGAGILASQRTWCPCASAACTTATACSKRSPARKGCRAFWSCTWRGCARDASACASRRRPPQRSHARCTRS